MTDTRWALFGLAWLATPQEAPAQYRFLGNRASYQRVPSRLRLPAHPVGMKRRLRDMIYDSVALFTEKT